MWSLISQIGLFELLQKYHEFLETLGLVNDFHETIKEDRLLNSSFMSVISTIKLGDKNFEDNLEETEAIIREVTKEYGGAPQ